MVLFDTVWTGKGKKAIIFETFDSDKKGETACVGKGEEPST